MDEITLLLSLFLAFILRLGDLLPDYIYASWWLFVAIPVITTPLFIKFGLYRSVLKYLGARTVTATIQSISISCLVIGFFMMFFREETIQGQASLPRSILAIFWFVSNVTIITSRFLIQGILYSWENLATGKRKTIIYGAGSAGIQILESLKKNDTYLPIAFIDDDKTKHGTIIRSLEVFPMTMINDLVKRKKVKELFFAMPSVDQIHRKEILKKLTNYPIEVKLLPTIDDIENGDILLDQIKDVDVGDILGREIVKPKMKLLRRNIEDKNILITGGGGSIGAELSRQIKKLNPNKIVLFDNSEYNLYSIHHELTITNGIEVVPVLATVTNSSQVNNVIKQYNIHTIYHAAAYKHVPMVERNVVSGVYNNVIGTYNLAESAFENDVENMVLISTDKAVRPTNVMGASKRFSELILQAFADAKSRTCFSMVRFGNVIDSAGSVVPLFRKQIKKGGPVTVTHRNITRYFMSIPEAVQLVLQAGAMAKGGDVFVLDMGEPIKILDLAYKMIHLSGLTPIDHENPDGDIKIKFTGLRAGEKLYEELLIGNNVVQSEHLRIMQAREDKLSMSTILKCIKIIKEARDLQKEAIIKQLLLEHVSGYSTDLTDQD
ncbi:MAG: nucleoside-diphosphate sugar epimerase/dehydratase [Bacteroidota bacterium]|nr:nucleoside-diphosphate sugar epimerase/dehydratase [Bacteroidota bacterium]